MRRLRGNLVVMTNLRGQKRAPFLPRARIEALRDARVRRIVAHAARTVPHYRDLFARERIDPRDIRGAQDLARLPLLDSSTVRADPGRFLSQSRRARHSLALTSSGLRGQPLELRHDQRSLLANIAFGERERAPVIELCGGAFRPRELHVGYETSNFRAILQFYAASTRLPAPRRESLAMTAPFEEIVAKINALRPDLLTGYGGFLDVFLRTVVARGVDLHAPKVVMYVGEALPAERRDWIEHELGAAVMSRYCAVEAFKIGYFCPARTGFHLHDDLCHVRVLADGRDAAPDEPGEVVISNLVNHASVLLNYRMGDVAALRTETCPCGRRHRLMSEVEGRLEDMLPLASGEHLHPRGVWSVFKEDERVLQYQLVQHDLRRFELKLVTVDEHAFAGSRDRAIRELQLLLGPESYIHASHHLHLGHDERGRSGKFRVVESRVSAARTAAPASGQGSG